MFVGLHKSGCHIMYEIFEKLLKERGISAYKVAKATGISTGSLSDWKKGRSSPKADKLQKIADYFGVSVDYLLGATNAKAKGSLEQEKKLDQQLEGIDFALYGEAKDLTYEQKLDVIDYIRFKKQKEK